MQALGMLLYSTRANYWLAAPAFMIFDILEAICSRARVADFRQLALGMSKLPVLIPLSALSTSNTAGSSVLLYKSL